ncbi:MAG: lipopolysaccharide biosynthesis protein, partial [Pseudomonadota bacterium]|nr:lipopolysaccharide biosynthesis protein [Pseudomonadota bacterium]
LGVPGEAVMGLVGPAFVAGTGALAILLAAEVVASMATVSESALVYVARHRNMFLSLAMIIFQAVLSVALILAMREMDLSQTWQATGSAIGLLFALGFAAIAKSLLLGRLLGDRVSGWRWPLIWAAAAAVIVGSIAIQLPEWAELLFGIPAILIAFGLVLWTRGFGPDDRELFRMSKADIDDLSLPSPADSPQAPR